MHGRGFKPSEQLLGELSFAALRAGIERDYPEQLDDFDALAQTIAWYADLSAAVLRETGRSYDESLDTDDRREAFAALRAISPRKRFDIRRYDRLPGKSAVKEFLADVLAPLIGATGLWRWACRRLAPDFAAYIDNRDGYGDAVRDRVRAAIIDALETNDELVILAHGTGSVAAWEVLSALSREPGAGDARKVGLFVTLGSPLGDNHVRRYLLAKQDGSADCFPANVESWCNVSAEDDYTCHDKTLADDYRRVLGGRRVSAITDYKIYNHAVRYGRSNPHSSIGYYIHPRVTRILVDWLAKRCVTTHSS